MLSFSCLVVGILTLCSTHAAALPLEARASSRVVYTFPNPTWLENLATTRSGNILTGVLAAGPGGTEAPLYIVDPFAADANTAASLLYAFPGANSVWGISELQPNVFAIATSTADQVSGVTFGSSTMWALTLNPAGDKGTPTVRKIADVPIAKLINGATVLNKNIIFAADPLSGVILTVDATTGTVKTVHTDPSLAPNLTAPLPPGVNGLKYSAPYLYYTNTQLGVFRVKVDPRTGVATGPYTKLATLHQPDDLAVKDGFVYVARPFDDEVDQICADNGQVAAVAGTAGNEIWKGVTSVSFGRTLRDRNVLYGCTFGGYAADGTTPASGGRIVAVDVA